MFFLQTITKEDLIELKTKISKMIQEGKSYEFIESEILKFTDVNKIPNNVKEMILKWTKFEYEKYSNERNKIFTDPNIVKNIILRLAQENIISIEFLKEQSEIKKLSLSDSILRDSLIKLTEEQKIILTEEGYVLKQIYDEKQRVLNELNKDKSDKKIMQSSKDWIKSFEEVFGDYLNYKTAIMKYGLVWARFQVDEINLLIADILKRKLIPDQNELKNFIQLIESLKRNQFKSWKEFDKTLYSIFENSSSPFSKQDEAFGYIRGKSMLIFSNKIKYIILGGKSYTQENALLKRKDTIYQPPILSNELSEGRWIDKAKSFIKLLYEKIMKEYFLEIYNYNQTIKVYLQNKDFPFKHLIRLPELTFGFEKIRWSFLGDENGSFHDGMYYYQKSEGNKEKIGTANYTIQIHEWELFWSLHYHWDENIDMLIHHECIHVIQDRYARIYDVLHDKDQRDLIPTQYLSLFQTAMAIFKVHADDVNKTGLFMNERKSFKEIFDYYMKKKHYTTMQKYLGTFGGHDYAFYYFAIQFGHNNNEVCEKALKQREYMERLWNIEYNKIYGRDMVSGRWITCKSTQPIEGTYNPNYY